MVTWVIFLTIGLVIGIAAGIFIGQLDDLKRKQREELQTKLESAEQELVIYKGKVTEHFVKTSVLVNNMTESYKAIHEHLSTGAGTLCDSQLDVGKLNISEVNVIEKQVTTEDQTVKSINSGAAIANEVEQLAEKDLTEKVKVAGFGGQSDLEVTESNTISDEEITEAAKSLEGAEEKSEPEEISTSESATKKDAEQKIDVTVNRTVH